MTANDHQYEREESYQQHEHSGRYAQPTPQYQQITSSTSSTRSRQMMPPPPPPPTSSSNRSQFRPAAAKATSQSFRVEEPPQSIPRHQQQQYNPRASGAMRTPFNPTQDSQTASGPNTAAPRKAAGAVIQQTPSSSRVQSFRPSSTVHGVHLPIGQNAPRGGANGGLRSMVGMQQMDQRATSTAPKSGDCYSSLKSQGFKRAYGR